MDTIFALASAPGKAGVSVIRVSGRRAFDAVSALAGDVPKPRVAALRTLRDSDGAHLDQALVLVFEHGASFTGERIAEFQIHGSVAVSRAVLRELAAIDGCRLAEPGEFTRRALENGQMDLTQVEALADLIEAETEFQRQHALKVLSGALAEKVGMWRTKLVRAASFLEAVIDFSDEDVPVDVSDEVSDLLTYVLDEVSLELDGLQATERAKTGYEVAIVGPPNAGKSTLLNYLAGRSAAITSNVAGTTRDVIEVRMEIAGFPVTLLDTAGLRETDDAVESIGVALAKERADSADMRVHLVPENGSPILDVRATDVVAIAKMDYESDRFGVSGTTGHGVSDLIARIKKVLAEKTGNLSLVSNERHHAVLLNGVSQLHQALEHLKSGPDSYEITSEDVRVAVRALESLLGHVDVEHLLDEIFSSFCIGK